MVKIIAQNFNYEKIKKVQSELVSDGVKLVYWASKNEMPRNEIKNLGDCLVYKKTMFVINLDGLNLDDFVSTHIVKKYDLSISANELEKLSIKKNNIGK